MIWHDPIGQHICCIKPGLPYPAFVSDLMRYGERMALSAQVGSKGRMIERKGKKNPPQLSDLNPQPLACQATGIPTVLLESYRGQAAEILMCKRAL